jgi:hypothetical protein
MKQPVWKRILSYFAEIELEAVSGQINPELVLSLYKGRYCLSTPNAIYSFADLYDNFTRSFQRIPLDKMSISDVLILGFGLGSIPYMLEKKFKQNFRYTGVEADEAIALWASRYVLDELTSPVEMHLMDAALFVEMCQDQYDMVVMDIFLDDEIPAEFQSKTYLERLQTLLKPEGVLLYNCLSLKEEDKIKTGSFFQNKFKKVFPAATYLDLGGNWMLLNRPL